jgi:hypothetical protein
MADEMTHDEQGASVEAVRNREITAQFARALEGRDWQRFAALLAEDVLYEIPQTREIIRGSERYVQFNAEFPGDWHITPERIIADETGASMLFRWDLDGGSSLAIVFFEIQDGLVRRITDFWPDPYEPPPGREHLVERV